MENQQEQTELKRIDFSQNWFMANGKKYVIETEFSIERWVMKEEIEMEVQYGVSVREMFVAWEEVYGLANQQRFADIVIHAYNKIKGLEKFTEREPSMLKFCALFCNVDGEDRKVITSDMITQKINDWKSEGLAISDFFTLAANTSLGFIENYRKATAKFSNKEEKE